jgi:geranylgeranyl diphosphate synthase type I
MMKFSPSLAELTAEVDGVLTSWLKRVRGGLTEAPLLVEEILRCIGAGGKRLRPAFCYWGYRSGGRAHGPEILRAASALELLHTFALVHDDIMDKGHERRGQPTTYALHGPDAAILVGDLALVLADEMLLTSGFPNDLLVPALHAYSRMRRHVIAGQHLDVAAASSEVITEAEARRIAVLKAGMYTVEEPLIIGAALAGAAPGVVEGLSAFGRPLGEAFQLRDDLLSSFGESPELGKPVDSDIRQGKRNVLFAKTAAALDGGDRDFFLARWGAPQLTGDEVARLRKLLESSGSKAETEELLDSLVAQAGGALRALPVEDDVRAALDDLMHRAVIRDV